MLAEIVFDFDPMIEEAHLAAEIASQWLEELEFDEEQVGRLQEMAARLEASGEASEAESARLAEMAERLFETAVPNEEHLRELQETVKQMAAAHAEVISEHAANLRYLRKTELEALARGQREILLSFERSAVERHELLEQAKRARELAYSEMSTARRQQLRFMMERVREQLHEQLRTLDEEIERHREDDALRPLLKE